MIERRPFAALPRQESGGCKAWCHFPAVARGDRSPGRWGCLRVWNDEEIASDAGLALQPQADVEIVTYVRKGAVIHRDGLGNESRIEAGNVHVVSAGTGIRHAVFNLEPAPVRTFRIWMAPDSMGGSPAWAAQPCATADRLGCFVAIASGLRSDQDALPIRARARVLNARMKVGESVEYLLDEPRLAYLVPSTGTIDVNGVRIHARDGAAIEGTDAIGVTAIEDADIVMVEMLQDLGGDRRMAAH